MEKLYSDYEKLFSQIYDNGGNCIIHLKCGDLVTAKLFLEINNRSVRVLTMEVKEETLNLSDTQKGGLFWKMFLIPYSEISYIECIYDLENDYFNNW